MRLRQHADQYESQDEESDYDHSNDYESDPDTDYMEVGREVNRMTVPTERSKRVRSGLNSMCREGVPADYVARFDQRDQVNQRHRQDHSRERRQWGPCGAAGYDARFCRRRCNFCKQVHDAGRFELFTELERLTKFVKSSIDRTTVPEEHQHIYSPGNQN